jgi:hypothetical protein
MLNPASLCQPTLWPTDRATRLAELQAAGRSYGEMATALGLSRNAVAGKCKRLGLTAVTVDKSITAARHMAGIALRDARLAARPRPEKTKPVHRIRREYTKSELRAMFAQAVLNTIAA